MLNIAAQAGKIERFSVDESWGAGECSTNMQSCLRIASFPLAVLMAFAAQAAERQVLTGQRPAAVARLQPAGNMPAETQLGMAIGLPLRNWPGLTNLLQQLYDPASPNYHRYLTPEQFAEQFGPTEQDYQKVIAFVEGHGLKVTGRHSNRLLLDASGSVADVERAFHVKMLAYPHPTNRACFMRRMSSLPLTWMFRFCASPGWTTT